MRIFAHPRHRRLLPAALALLVSTVACGGDPAARRQKFFESGNAYVERGDHRAAIIEYRNAVEIDPLFGEARAKLAEAYANVGDGPNALAEYVRAADLLPGDFDVQLRAGAFLLAANGPEQALLRADAALKLRPDDITAHILRGNALAGLKSFDDALAAIEEAIRLDPQRGATFTQKGLIELASGRGAEAEAAFRRAVELAPASVDAHLALGNYYWSGGRAPETERAFRAAIDLEPGHPGANRAMAALLMATGRVADAEAYFRKLADSSKDAGSVLALADYYLLTDRSREAIARLTPLVSGEAAEPVPAAKERLARAHAAAGDRVKAEALVGEILATDKANLEAQLLKGQLLLDGGKRDEALAAVRSAVDAHPDSAEAHYALGKLYEGRGDSTAADAAFREVLRLNPRAAAAQVALSRLQLSAGDAAASVRSAEEAARAEPGSLEARLALVRSLIAARDLARAARELTPLQAQYPDLGEVHVQSGLLAALQNDEARARSAFERALAIDGTSAGALAGLIALDMRAGDVTAARGRIEGPLKGGAPSPDLLLLAARTYVSANDLPAAEAVLRRAIDANPTFLPAYSMLGQVYLSQKKLDAARREFDAMAARQARPVAALTMSGVILQTQGDVEQARQRFEQALRVDPRAPIAANNLAWLQAEAGENLDTALQLAQTAVAGAPDTPEITDTLGWIYYRKNMPEQAIPQFVRSVQRAPGVATYQYHLGLAYLQAGDAGRAKAALQGALASKPDSTMAADIQRALARTSGTN